MALFKDSTGRPGPATWVAGEYPAGQDDYPVTGVSWFEAAAYAEFAGKQLPTIYHWLVAAQADRRSDRSFRSATSLTSGSRAWASTSGMSWSGAMDMAGNAKEWALNEGKPGLRYLLGGSWDDPTYMFNNPDARSPFDRGANFGFRCARYVSDQVTARAAQPIVPAGRDYSKEKPVSDQIFAAYKSLYSYDKVPLARNHRSDRTKRELDPTKNHHRRGLRPRTHGGLSLPAEAGHSSFPNDRLVSGSGAVNDHTLNNLDCLRSRFRHQERASRDLSHIQRNI